jgi:hypothetical protein
MKPKWPEAHPRSMFVPPQMLLANPMERSFKAGMAMVLPMHLSIPPNMAYG